MQSRPIPESFAGRAPQKKSIFYPLERLLLTPASPPKRDLKVPREAQPLASWLAQEAADLRLLYLLQLFEHGLHA